MKESKYIEREETVRTVLSALVDILDLHNTVQAIKIANKIREIPTADVVSRGMFEQVKWERNMALQTLQVHGIGLGEKADVAKVVRCKECKYCIVNKNHPDKPLICTMTKMCGTTSPEWYCAAGKRKEGAEK